MANNCLVTKLKGIVNNDSLQKLGVIHLKVDGNSVREYHLMNFSCYGGNCKIWVDGGGQFSLGSASATKVTEYTVTASQNPTDEIEIFFTPGTYNIYIDNKYCITSLYIRDDSAIYIDKEIDYLLALRRFRTANSKSSIKLSNFTKSTGLTEFLTEYAMISGSINDLGGCINLTSLIIQGATGDVEEFVASQISAGRSSVSYENAIFIMELGDAVKFHGRTMVDAYYTYLCWESNSKITVHAGGSSGKTGTDLVYEKGATAQEIAAWQAAGKTVTDVISGTVYPPTNG